MGSVVDAHDGDRQSLLLEFERVLARKRQSASLQFDDLADCFAGGREAQCLGERPADDRFGLAVDGERTSGDQQIFRRADE